MLKLDIRQTPPRSLWLVSRVTLGKNPQNDIVLNAPEVEDFHLAFEVDHESVILVNKSQSGTFVNGERIDDRVSIKSGDWITAGGVGMDIIDPRQVLIENDYKKEVKADTWMLKAITGWLAGKEYVIENSATVGRDEDCTISIPTSHLSRKHAEITRQADKLYIKDLASANGTFLNGERIVEAEVVPGDELRFDLLSFLVLGPEKNQQPERRPMQFSKITAIDVSTPAVRLGEAKPTSLGNSEEAVREYNEKLAAYKAEKKRVARAEKRDAILGWVIVIALISGLIFAALLI